jgi:hypothetical protein
MYKYVFCVLICASATITAGDNAKVSSASMSDTVIPHIAFGGAWKTIVTLVNVQHVDTDVTVRFYDDNGVALPVPTDTQGNTPEYRVKVAGNGSHQFMISGGETVRQGWADVIYDSNLGDVRGAAVFRQVVPGRQDLEALSPSCNNTWQQRIPFDETAGYQLGLAMANPNSEAVVVSAVLRGEDGKALNDVPVEIHLPAKGHTSFLASAHTGLKEFIKGRGVIDFVGSGTFAVMGLRFSPTFSFTTILPYDFSY